MAWRRGNCSDSVSPRDHAWSWGRRDGGPTHLLQKEVELAS